MGQESKKPGSSGEAPAQKEAMADSLVEQSNDGVLVVDSDRRIRFCNSAAGTFFEQGHRDLFQLLFDTEPEPGVTRETPITREGGEPGVGEVLVTRTEWRGAPAYLVSVRDITDRKKAERERQKIEAQIQQTQKLESLGVLAGGIAHDFNNLLMGILGNTELALEDTSQEGQVHTSLMEIQKAGRRAAELCRQMLSYSGKGRLMVRPVCINDTLSEMAELIKGSISKKADLCFDLDENLPEIEADLSELRQVIMSLVTNSSEAIDNGPGTITVSTGTVHCTREFLARSGPGDDLPEGDYVYLEVRDNGCGMSPDTRARIFDPFFSTKFMGRGLGLSAVLGIVRGHNGMITVESTKGEGTVFKVLMPVVASEKGPVPKTQPPHKGDGVILLVDDEEAVRCVGERLLQRMGYTVYTAQDGHDAIRVFKERGGSIDCVLLDLSMPDLDGRETFRELRKLRPDIPVILSSGYNEQQAENRFLRDSLAGFIQKPYQSTELAARIDAALNASGSAAKTDAGPEGEHA